MRSDRRESQRRGSLEALLGIGGAAGEERLEGGSRRDDQRDRYQQRQPGAPASGRRPCDRTSRRHERRTRSREGTFAHGARQRPDGPDVFQQRLHRWVEALTVDARRFALRCRALVIDGRGRRRDG